MLNLNPRESFIITHQLNNSYITDTSYVRAVIRNAKTDVTLATKDLTDQGNGRFTTTYQVPADVSGQGFYISIVTSVYSDSGYTTKSQNYGDEVNTYLVQERYNPNIALGATGGPDIDYKRIQKIVNDEINKIEKPKVIDLSPVISGIKSIKEDLSNVEIPEYPITNLTPVIDSIKESKTSIVKKIESIPEFDYSIITDAIKTYSDDLTQSIEKNYSFSDSQKKDFITLMKGALDNHSARFEKMKKMKDLFEAVFPENENEDTTSMVETDNKPKEKLKETKPEVDSRVTRLMNMNKI